jgi:threonine synthase
MEIVYDYGAIASHISREAISARRDVSMWRYRELLPIEADADTSGLRAGGSPLYPGKRLGELIGLRNLFIKDDGVNPTASLKDRASAMAVVKASEAGADTIACSSTGNAASSLAGAAAARGFKTYIFVPKRAPQAKVTQLLIFGAHVISVQGDYEDTFRLSAEAIDRWGWYNRNAAINPYLSEGKKTVAYEIAEQLGWQAPDYLAVSVGDGCTIAGVWKGFKDLRALGFIDKLPRLISVQAAGCCPINNAVDAGVSTLTPMEENTIADSIAVGVPRNFHKAVAAVNESGGIAVNVSDAEILDAMALTGRIVGVFGEPAGIAGTAGLIKAAKQGRIPADATVVSIVTGNGLKDIANAIKAVHGPIIAEPDIKSLIEKLIL